MGHSMLSMFIIVLCMLLPTQATPNNGTFTTSGYATTNNSITQNQTTVLTTTNGTTAGGNNTTTTNTTAAGGNTAEINLGETTDTVSTTANSSTIQTGQPTRQPATDSVNQLQAGPLYLGTGNRFKRDVSNQTDKCNTTHQFYCIHGQCFEHRRIDAVYCVCEMGYMGSRCELSSLIEGQQQVTRSIGSSTGFYTKPQYKPSTSTSFQSTTVRTRKIVVTTQQPATTNKPIAERQAEVTTPSEFQEWYKQLNNIPVLRMGDWADMRVVADFVWVCTCITLVILVVVVSAYLIIKYWPTNSVFRIDTFEGPNTIKLQHNTPQTNYRHVPYWLVTVIWCTGAVCIALLFVYVLALKFQIETVPDMPQGDFKNLMEIHSIKKRSLLSIPPTEPKCNYNATLSDQDFPHIVNGDIPCNGWSVEFMGFYFLQTLFTIPTLVIMLLVVFLKFLRTVLSYKGYMVLTTMIAVLWALFAIYFALLMLFIFIILSRSEQIAGACLMLLTLLVLLATFLYRLAQTIKWRTPKFLIAGNAVLQVNAGSFGKKIPIYLTKKPPMVITCSMVDSPKGMVLYVLGKEILYSKSLITMTLHTMQKRVQYVLSASTEMSGGTIYLFTQRGLSLNGMAMFDRGDLKLMLQSETKPLIEEDEEDELFTDKPKSSQTSQTSVL